MSEIDEWIQKAEDLAIEAAATWWRVVRIRTTCEAVWFLIKAAREMNYRMKKLERRLEAVEGKVK